jgi:hypothetical protein
MRKTKDVEVANQPLEESPKPKKATKAKSKTTKASKASASEHQPAEVEEVSAASESELADDQEIEELILEFGLVPTGQGVLPSSRALESYLRTFSLPLKVTQTRHGSVFSIFNPETQVDCEFVLSPTELWAELPLPRASVYAVETIPWVVRLAREYNLHCEVLFPETQKCDPFEPSFEALMEVWQRANWEERTYQERLGQVFYTCPAHLLEASWEYSLLCRELTRRYGRSKVEVHPVTYWACKASHQVYRVATWDQLLPTILPDVDLVQLLNPPSPLRHGATYVLKEVSESLSGLIKNLAMPIQHFLYEKKQHQKSVIEAIAKLKPIATAEFRKIEFADCQDDQPPVQT